MNNQKVVGWLRDEGTRIYEVWVDLIGHDRAKAKADKWNDRASQVEAMTCDRCRYWHKPNKIGRCVHELNEHEHWAKRKLAQFGLNFCGPKFGCNHWEEKK